jgi:hypothetical protein
MEVVELVESNLATVQFDGDSVNEKVEIELLNKSM